MEEALPGLWSLTPIGGMIGMIALVYWLLVTGRLITKASHEREIGIYKEIIVNKDATIAQLTDQNGRLLSVVDTVKGVLQYARPDEDTAPSGGA